MVPSNISIKGYNIRANWELYIRYYPIKQINKYPYISRDNLELIPKKLWVAYKLNSAPLNLNLYSCRPRLEQVNMEKISAAWITSNIAYLAAKYVYHLRTPYQISPYQKKNLVWLPSYIEKSNLNDPIDHNTSSCLKT